MSKKNISPHKWSIEVICQGMQNDKWIELGKTQFKQSGCRKTFEVTYFDLYKTANIVFALSGIDYHITCNCKHCGEPNYIGLSIKSDIDQQFIKQLPIKYKRFFKAY